VQSLLSWLLQTLLSSGVAILAFFFLQSTKMGEQWFSHRLNRKLTELKHSHDAAIESLRAELAHLGDRRRRANEQEFEALSTIWDAFVDAFLETSKAIASFQSFPDLDQLQSEDLNTFLESTELSSAQRQQVSNAEQKVKTFGKILDIRQINSAGDAVFKVWWTSSRRRSTLLQRHRSSDTSISDIQGTKGPLVTKRASTC
jgi:hypothetical protein